MPASCSPYTNCGQPGVYGTLGTPSPANVPAGRHGAVSWTDSSGNLWLFGGEANHTDALDYHGDMNDLWEFSPTTEEWTWMGGSDSPLQSCNGQMPCSPLPVYGLWQTPAAGNIPGAREDSTAWVDSKGNAWLFGGFGLDSTGSLGDLNDLWEFDPATNQWAWMSGSTLQGQYGSEGSQGTASFQTSPGGRNSAAGWTDGTGNLWLIGGFGFSPQEGFVPLLGDLWEFQPYAANGLPAAAVPAFSLGGGTYTSVQSVTLSDSTPGAVIYYMIDSKAPPAQYTGAIAVNFSETIQAIAVASGYADSPAATAIYTLNLPPPPAPAFDPPSGSYSGPRMVTISDSQPGVTIYYTTDGSVPTTQSLMYTGSFLCASSETVNAIAVAGGTSVSSVASVSYIIQPAPANTWTFLNGSNQLGQPPAYAPLGTASASAFPGARGDAATWTTADGSFWMMGGWGSDENGNTGYMNDLWKFSPSASPQNAVWTWMGGSMIVPCPTASQGTSNPCSGPSGVYGTLGSPASANFPGGRQGASTWITPDGRLWLFGGYGTSTQGVTGYLNDLWNYSPSTGMWTWVSGSSSYSLLNLAEAYGQAGTYGTLGVPASGNTPGSRHFTASWIDASGNLWLFGGEGIDAAGHLGQLNDLWMFNPSTSVWMWVGGWNFMNNCDTVPTQCGRPGVYGIQGTPATSNLPGGRSQAVTWTDSNGNFWLFGGDGEDSAGPLPGALNDLWQFNPSTGLWTWMTGSTTLLCGFNDITGHSQCGPQPDIFGTLGVAASANAPGGHMGSAGWVDSVGNFWMFGSQEHKNDLWMYGAGTGMWTWMGGDYTPSNCTLFQFVVPGGGLDNVLTCDGSQGQYAAQYLQAVGNVPGARTNAATWVDKNGKFWLFGGSFTDLSDDAGFVNDLWTFQPAAGVLPPVPNPIISLKSGNYVSGGQFALSNGIANSAIYYTTDGSTPTSGSNVYQSPLTLSGSETVRAMAGVPGYVPSGITTANYLFLSTPAAPTLSPGPGTYTSPQNVNLHDTSAGAEIYYTTDGSAPSPSSNIYQNPLSVSTTETISAVGVANGFGVYDGSISEAYGMAYGDQELTGPTAVGTYTINLPVTATPTFSVPGGTYASVQSIAISDTTPGAAIYYTTNGTIPSTSSTVYSGAIVVSSTETLQALATASGYATSALASATYTIPQDFSVTASPASFTVTPGQSGTASISVTPANGFNSAVSFACSGLPSGASCGLSPATVTPSGSTASTTLTLATSSTTPALARRNRPLFPLTVLVGALLFFSLGRRRQLRMLVLLAVSGLGLSLLISCSGGSGSGGGSGGGGGRGTTPVTSTVTVTATSGSLQHTATISLTVN